MTRDFCDDFDAASLDTDVWLPHYLPQWSSRAESAATYAVRDSEVRLSIHFPAHAAAAEDPDHVPELAVDYVRGAA